MIFSLCGIGLSASLLVKTFMYDSVINQRIEDIKVIHWNDIDDIDNQFKNHPNRSIIVYHDKATYGVATVYAQQPMMVAMDKNIHLVNPLYGYHKLFSVNLKPNLSINNVPLCTSNCKVYLPDNHTTATLTGAQLIAIFSKITTISDKDINTTQEYVLDKNETQKGLYMKIRKDEYDLIHIDAISENKYDVMEEHENIKPIYTLNKISTYCAVIGLIVSFGLLIK